MAARSEASQNPVPIDGTLLEALADWSRRTLYREADDWIFASPVMDGRQPLHGFCSFVFPRQKSRGCKCLNLWSGLSESNRHLNLCNFATRNTRFCKMKQQTAAKHKT